MATKVQLYDRRPTLIDIRVRAEPVATALAADVRLTPIAGTVSTALLADANSCRPTPPQREASGRVDGAVPLPCSNSAQLAFADRPLFTLRSSASILLPGISTNL
jgi:hypothetical protein